jgi:predicted amidohydrolase
MKTSPEPAIFRVSVIQPALRRYDREYNIERNLEMIRQEGETHRPHAICIPNYFFQTGLEGIPGPATERLALLARQLDTCIIGGMGEEAPGGGGFNAGFIIFPGGEIRLFQRKLHLITMEKARLQGGCGLTVMDSPLGRLGCVLCNDVFYPETARCLALQGAEIIFVPSVIGGTGIRGLEAVARARAVENQVYVVNANGIPLEAAGQNPGLEMGRSGIYSPFLEKIDLARAGTGEEAIRALLDMDELREVKRTIGLDARDASGLARGKSFNMLVDRRPSQYGEITRTP